MALEGFLLLGAVVAAFALERSAINTPMPVAHQRLLVLALQVQDHTTVLPQVTPPEAYLLWVALHLPLPLATNTLMQLAHLLLVELLEQAKPQEEDQPPVIRLVEFLH